MCDSFPGVVSSCCRDAEPSDSVWFCWDAGKRRGREAEESEEPPPWPRTAVSGPTAREEPDAKVESRVRGRLGERWASAGLRSMADGANRASSSGAAGATTSTTTTTTATTIAPITACLDVFVDSERPDYSPGAPQGSVVRKGGGMMPVIERRTSNRHRRRKMCVDSGQKWRRGRRRGRNPK